MRCVFPILGVVLAAQTVLAQEKKPWSVDQICGRVDYVKRIPEKKHPNNFSENRKSLKGVPLELYEAGDSSPCCDGLKMVGSVVSGKRGEFEFKAEKPGHYWLAAKWNEKHYKVDVVYEPQKKSSTICSQQGIQIVDEEDASWFMTVTVD